ncbi:LysR family transcriptional regulator ArgP [Cellulomonas soli]|uniref:HTH-type transcriptional regulator LysG n=1 Tax=Cellulomonas soli TaxID=931535 RepID=A0A512P912_9CELL|nr:LysR family transcriptional regulator ArgP [Cellulomonas soli]NYI57910.1 LysR family transcriptional regulator (chromosome initiation inhibitor) [Cellulomonas soli]GEP67694.1 putative transcriptional regulator, LysR family protein [Cellulomonas soli]
MTVPFDLAQLEALAAVVGEGSFDAAARRLHVTPSAVSQRIKALEQQAGHVLVRRSRPCRATAAGEALVRLAGQVDLLAQDALDALEVLGGPTRLAVAVNADSLSTWFPAALVDLPAGVLVELHREDQDHSARLLRDGTAMAAVTADAEPVQGCRSRPLGAMRYVAVAAPSYLGRHLPDGPTREALAVAPVVAFNRQDALQDRFVEQLVGPGLRPPAHHVPEQQAFVDLVRAGLGWGMVPERAAAQALAAGGLVPFAPGQWLEVPLHWQHWSLRTPTLDLLTSRVVSAARSGLRPASGRRSPTGAGSPAF